MSIVYSLLLLVEHRAACVMCKDILFLLTVCLVSMSSDVTHFIYLDSLFSVCELRCLGQEVGYCPQEDALDRYLTGEETLLFHARLHGFNREQAKRVS